MNRKYLRATGLAILAGLSALAFRPREEQATALFAGGCFWSMQKAFDGVPGVVRTTVGFAGGTNAKQVSSTRSPAGLTGYAEIGAGGVRPASDLATTACSRSTGTTSIR